jgi:hypothetical protein
MAVKRYFAVGKALRLAWKGKRSLLKAQGSKRVKLNKSEWLFSV